jgi:hypothetical protein
MAALLAILGACTPRALPPPTPPAAAVVSSVISERTILVTQANWVAHRVTEDMPVMDVSPANDWSAVRVWWPPSGQMGSRHYPTWGFILPDRPMSRDGLEASMRETLRITSSD